MIDELKIPEYFIEDIRDKDERSRYEYEDGWILIILRIPYVRKCARILRTPQSPSVSSLTKMCV